MHNILGCFSVIIVRILDETTMKGIPSSGYRIAVDSSSKHGEVDVSHELSSTTLAMNYQGNDHDFVHTFGVASPNKVLKCPQTCEPFSSSSYRSHSRTYSSSK